MGSIEKTVHDLELIDASTSTSDSIEHDRESLHQPLTWLSPQLVKHKVWKRHVWLVLHTLIPRWAFVFMTSDNRKDMESLVATLIGSSSTMASLRATMAQISLPLLLECIRDLHTTDPTFSLDVLDAYTTLLKKMSGPLVSIYLRHANAIIDLSSFCSLLCSIPSRLSNAYGMQQAINNSHRYWYLDRNFYPSLAKYIALEIDFVYDMVKSSFGSDVKQASGCLDMAGELVGKMIRQGYQDVCMETMIPIARQQYTTHSDPQCSSVWDQLWTRCEKTAPAEKLYEAILGYINKHMAPLQEKHATFTVSNNCSWSNFTRPIIQHTASQLAPVLFFNKNLSTPSNQVTRIQAFLTFALKDTSKIRLKNELVIRTVVAIAVHAVGLERLGTYEIKDDCVFRLSMVASDMIVQLLYDVIDIWTDPVFIKQSSDSERRDVTTVLLILFGYTDNTMMENIQQSTGIMMGISTWLKTADINTAKLAMVVAESISSRTKNQDDAVLDFGIPMESWFKNIKELATIGDGLTQIVETYSFELPSTGTAVDNNDDDDIIQEIEEDLDPDLLVDPDDEDEEQIDEEDSDLEPYPMEEESDEEDDKNDDKTDPKKKKARIPVYISELINYLKDSEDPEKLEIGLNAAERIIRQKTNVGTEIDEWAMELANRLVYFPDVYEIDNDKQLLQSSLTALLVACPEKVASFLIEQFFSQNTSIFRKNIILASISTSIFELSGWTSDHKLNMDSTLALEPLDMVSKSANTTGKIVFTSSRVQADLKRQKGITKNRLSGLVGRSFFFPLINGWWASPQTKLRWIIEDPMLVERFIMTLNVIMQCGSNTPDRRKIVKEYFDYALSIRYIPKLSTQGLRALLIGIHTILHICYKDQGSLLLKDYSIELSSTIQWLEDILENLTKENEIQELILTLLASLSNIYKMIN